MTRLTLNRRTLMQTGAAALAAQALPVFAKTPADFKSLLDVFAEEILRLVPESATGLGLDTGKRTRLKSRLNNLSFAADDRWAVQVASMKARLQRFDRAKLSAAERIRYDTVLYAAARGIEGAKFSYGGAAGGFFGGATPYPVTQQDGAMTSVPEFLDSQHSIATKVDADAYISRLRDFARQLDQETARIRRDAGKGIMPPSFVAQNALAQLKAFRATKSADQRMVSSLAERCANSNMAGNWAVPAIQIIEQEIYPALDRQIGAFAAAVKNAPDTAGVHRLPDGEAYYAWALKLGTTTNLTPAEIHAIGLEQNKMIQGRMDAILKAQGLTQGTVGARLLALTKDPRMIYPDTDQGRTDLIAYCNDRVAAMRKLMPKLTHMDLKAPLIIKRVAPDIQDGASLGYMNFAALDGSRPAIYYINLKSTSLWPKYQLATLTAHEGLPGHTWQGAYLAERSKEIPLISSLMGFNAFIEGWALYSEQLCDEQGLYADDPFSQLGYLQAQQFRACRLVVDTGLHAMRWTRAQSVQFLVENTGRGENSMTSETDRYSVSPGQACGYKVGHNEIVRLRDKAKSDLGAKFDLAGFNDAVVQTGGVPLTVLATAMDDYVKGVAV
jgi:uncharacterized protein (DUF885 family)